MKYILAILFLIGTLFARDMSPIKDYYEGKYKDYKIDKSFAGVYNEETGEWIIGVTYHATNKAIAKRMAIKKCKEAAKKYNLEAGCKTYALNRIKYF